MAQFARSFASFPCWKGKEEVKSAATLPAVGLLSSFLGRKEEERRREDQQSQPVSMGSGAAATGGAAVSLGGGGCCASGGGVVRRGGRTTSGLSLLWIGRARMSLGERMSLSLKKASSAPGAASRSSFTGGMAASAAAALSSASLRCFSATVPILTCAGGGSE